MLWKCNVDLNTSNKADAKYVRNENTTKNIGPNTRRGNDDVPQGIMSSTVYTKSQTSWRTLHLEDYDGRDI